jgi:hypothetical protein
LTQADAPKSGANSHDRSGTRLAISRFVPNPGTKQTMTAATARPVCDEWGLYDPEQAGFEALVRRLIPEDDEARRAQALSLPLRRAASTRWP